MSADPCLTCGRYYADCRCPTLREREEALRQEGRTEVIGAVRQRSRVYAEMGSQFDEASVVLLCRERGWTE